MSVSGGGYDVLLIGLKSHYATRKGVVRVLLEPSDPYGIISEISAFVSLNPRPAVILAGVDQLLLRHHEEEVARFLEEIQKVVEGKGPFIVGLDPERITATGALAVRASVASADALTTLESLRNPIRRLVIQRLGEGPCTFMQAVSAAL